MSDARESLWRRWLRWCRHRCLPATVAHRAVPPDMADRLQRRVAASEQRHSGEICLCVEGVLPDSDLWRAGRDEPLQAVVRERALAWFGTLRVWDTERNNGVLIYLLLAERRIDIVADRGIARHVPDAHWQGVVQRLAARLRTGDTEGGLTEALEEVSALLVEHFPLTEGEANPNELADHVRVV
ncbi:MAG: TPM domain-containing protein [Hydrogenophaga sp.]|jgi:uncharacterized membrane protein|uniref:TPM domain-containing protein n=1 Tax=Hydrogenophaga sp. TaxID=1904254 RepID=UPI000ECC0405|nr:TPM domain-containing protein [Hydrogenophaga sp.]MDD3784547.1 TPM domain-containing protein [Hydrogenophaga sp.]MDX9968049.1 TPM domain-containing protein [Hydrogenophaga sp.]HAJ14545.1 hypothetical protein [Comamonadaceae bacterium]